MPYGLTTNRNRRTRPRYPVAILTYAPLLKSPPAYRALREAQRLLWQMGIPSVTAQAWLIGTVPPIATAETIRSVETTSPLCHVPRLWNLAVQCLPSQYDTFGFIHSETLRFNPEYRNQVLATLTTCPLAYAGRTYWMRRDTYNALHGIYDADISSNHHAIIRHVIHDPPTKHPRLPISAAAMEHVRPWIDHARRVIGRTSKHLPHPCLPPYVPETRPVIFHQVAEQARRVNLRPTADTVVGPDGLWHLSPYAPATVQLLVEFATQTIRRSHDQQAQ